MQFPGSLERTLMPGSHALDVRFDCFGVLVDRVQALRTFFFLKLTADIKCEPELKTTKIESENSDLSQYFLESTGEGGSGT